MICSISTMPIKEQEQLAATALDSGKRCLQILNDLVDASRLNLGKLTLEHRQFALRPIINDMVDLITPQSEKKNVRVVSEFSADAPDYVYGDELRIRQVLHNLCFNAVKFTQSGEVRIAVGLVSSSEQQTTLKFTVSDTGIGISDEQKSLLFQPFVQAESSTSRIFGGTGLGLSIASTLCELMGGEIGVESQLGKGSAFWIKLPFHEECRPVCMQTS
jgi:signal transduction histidine kinase